MKLNIMRILSYLVITGAAVLYGVPIIWIIVSSFKPVSEALTGYSLGQVLFYFTPTLNAYNRILAGPFTADLINSIPKYVASTTLDNAAWNNTTVIKGDLVTEVARLKQQGGDILMHGFGPVANTLITNGLLDSAKNGSSY